MELILKEINLIIKYPDVDIIIYRNLVENLKNLTESINNCLHILDINNKSSIINDIKQPIYSITLSKYFWLILHINNPFIYNNYINKLIKIHKSNVEILNSKNQEYIQKEKKSNNIKKHKLKNKYKRIDVINIFTNEIEYDYINEHTGDKITSKNPNLLDKLNTKNKKVKNTTVPLEHMTFSFNKLNK